MKRAKKTNDALSNTLLERGKSYGEFSTHAEISQNLKAVMRGSPQWDNLSSDKKEALEMTAHKIARILNGNPELPDSWHDIAGYARLAHDRVK